MLFPVLFWTCWMSASCVKMINMRQNEGKERVDALVSGQSERGVFSIMMLEVYMGMQLLQLYALLMK
jgi:hypothetical protein